MELIKKHIDQSIFDVLLENSGALSGLFEFLHANNLTSLDIPAGEYIAPEILKPEVVNFFMKLNFEKNLHLVSSDNVLPAYQIIIQAINSAAEIIASGMYAPGTGTQELIIPDGSVDVLNSLGNIVSNSITISGSNSQALAPNGTVDVVDTLGNVIVSGATISGANTEVEAPDVNHTDSNGLPVALRANVPMVCTPAPPSGAWVRNPDWLAMPVITSADTKIAILYAIYENRENTYYFNVSSGTFSIDVDWGDGGAHSTITTTAVTSHTYTYAGISSIVLVDEYGENYKQVLIIITSNSGTPVQFNLGSTTSLTRNTSLDILASWATSRFQMLKAHPLLERLDLQNYTYSSVNMNSYFLGLSALRIINFAQTIVSPTSFSVVFGSIGNCIFPNMTITGTPSLANAWQSSNVREFGNIIATGAIATNSTWNSMQNLRLMGDINIPASTTLASGLAGNPELLRVGTITSTALTTIANVCNGDYSLIAIAFSSLANVNVTTGAFTGCYSLAFLRVTGIKVSFSVIDCAFERAELVQILNDLDVVAVAQTFTCTRCPGANDLTAADILIGTSKNWIVVP